MKLAELVLLEAKGGFKLYTEHPYGGGFMDIPVKKGEKLPTDDGDEVVFDHIDKAGDVFCKVDGEVKKVAVADIGGIVVPAGESVKGRKGFIAMGGKMFEDELGELKAKIIAAAEKIFTKVGAEGYSIKRAAESVTFTFDGVSNEAVDAETQIESALQAAGADEVYLTTNDHGDTEIVAALM